MKLAESTPLSDFIRNATPAEKEAVYRVVLDKATERQNMTLEILGNQKQVSGFALKQEYEMESAT